MKLPLIAARCLAAGSLFVSIAAGAASLPPEVAKTLDAVLATEVAAGHLTGAVVFVGDAEGILYRGVMGDRITGTQPVPMSADTIFDLASVTKPVAAATAVLQLVERGKLALDRPVAAYWAAFGRHGKQSITLRQLLTHTSGLAPGVSSRRALRSRAAVLQDILAMSAKDAPGERVVYSDINYVVLGEIVERASGVPLDVWCEINIFAPLGMSRTGFRPDPRDTAPTAWRDGKLLAGTVHDPIADALGGVSGNAGLFSTADNLARYATMLLRGGVASGTETRILSPESVNLMSTPATLDSGGPVRSVGWSVEPPLIANRYRTAPAGTLSHLGYTGTGLWIDLVTKRFIVILSSRLYPAQAGDATVLRANILGAISSTSPPMTARAIAAAVPSMAAAVGRALRLPQSRGPVENGIDVLEGMQFAPLEGRRIALITNRSGFDAQGRRTLDVLASAPSLKLVRIFAPEHGLDTDLDVKFGDSPDERTGLPVRSLYTGEWGIPKGDLADMDAVVFDIQDAGVRFFTYIAILGQALESASAARIPIFILDRPNPMGARHASGPVSDPGPTVLTAYHPLALAHGMTVGELARMFNTERGIGADLHVVRMRGYDRSMSFADTGLGWVPPSPNLRDAEALAWYPDIGLIEGGAISVGRGTPTPFSVVGAPWLRPELLSAQLTRLRASVNFTPVHFVPTEGPYAGKLCAGLRFTRPGTGVPSKPGQLGLALAIALAAVDPVRFRLEALRTSVGSDVIWQMLKHGRSLTEVFATVDEQVAAFESRRAAYLIY
ncbi:serine hydrolase [Cupriavidus campinensis]|uniref:serine hydrolase n=1 Tax=Cupriavidus campinensis TaxID=151783 RepID=UPI0011EF9F5C|nr:serine hydrolase [Cupriavidus campinensis]